MTRTVTGNPAGRLYDLFNDLLTATPSDNARNAKPLGPALAEVWGLNWPDDHAGVAVRVADAVLLPDQIQEQITAWVDDPRVYADLALAHQASWRRALRATANLDGSVLSLTQHLNNTNLQGLQIAARALGTVAPELQPSSDDLEQLGTAVAALLQEVLDADLDEEIRIFLLDQLRLIQDAIARARVRGVQALYDAFDQVSGATRFRRSPAARRLREEKPDLAQKFWAVLTNLATVVTLVQGGIALTGDIGDLLALDSGPAATVQAQESTAPSAPSSMPAQASTPSPVDLPGHVHPPRRVLREDGEQGSEAVDRAGRLRER